MKHITENNQYEKSISSEMLNFCPLCVAEVYQNGYSSLNSIPICISYLVYISLYRSFAVAQDDSVTLRMTYIVEIYQLLFIILHQEDLHEIVQIAIEDTLGV